MTIPLEIPTARNGLNDSNRTWFVNQNCGVIHPETYIYKDMNTINFLLNT